jgi:AcrR family transcriptional regulator
MDAILVAAREVFTENPAAGLDVIASRAGVHRATLYRHFATREALVSSLYEAYLDDAEAVILESDVEAPDLLAEIERLTRRVYAVNLDWKAFAWAPAYTHATQVRREQMTLTTFRLFQAAYDRGVLRRDLSIRQLLVAWGAPILFLAARIDEGAWTLDEVVEHTMLMIAPPA